MFLVYSTRQNPQALVRETVGHKEPSRITHGKYQEAEFQMYVF